ncbi:hypothetical protein SK128_013484 [Halocaridina rubra]|uniref:Extracellular sulfatase C-terminal domain-containing protein n=1 Tax=Halocaridina rubra TaxID=373956 RepID=A0AAN8XNM3_HALRR
MGFLVKLDSEERRKQRLFLKKHASQDIKKFDPKFLRAFSDVDSSEVAEETLGRVQRNSRWSQGQQKRKNRQRRDVLEDIPDPVDPDFEDLEKVIPSEVKDNVEAFVNEEEMRAIDDKITTLSDELEGLETVSSTSATSLAPGNDSLISHDMTDVDSSQLGHGCRATETSVDCTEEVYQDPHAWKVSKTAIDDQIRRLRHQLYVLKHVRKHLRNTRPNTLVTLEDYDYPESGESGFGPDFSSLDEILSNSGDHSSFAAEVSDFRDSSQRKIFPLDTGTHAGTLFINVEDTGQDSPNNKTNHRDEGEATFTEDREDVFEDVGSAEIDYDHIGMTPIAVDESSEVVIHSPAAVDESSEVVIQEGEDIIYGRDYDVDSDRGYSHSKNYMSGRRRSKGKKEKFDVFHHSSYNKARNKNRNKKNNRKNDDNDTTLDINGVRISSSDILSGRGRSESTLQFQFYPARESVPGRRQPSVIDNETSPTQPICWCDKK